MFTDKNGESCKCVPYYLCNKNNEGVDVNNASVTGWGVLDVRYISFFISGQAVGKRQ